MKKVCVVGAGFVGLVTAAYLSDNGSKVIVVDSDSKKISRIRDKGKAPFFEKDLDKILIKNLNQSLFFTDNFEEALNESEIVFVCVGTPVLPSGKIDLQYIDLVSKQIGQYISKSKDSKTVVIKSTVIPGTTSGIIKDNLESFSGKSCGEGFDIVMNPEFLREGSAVWDTYNPDRIIIGAENIKISKKILSLFKIKSSTSIFETNIETAEISKYCSNSFFAMLISFSNEIAKICEIFPSVDSRDIFSSLYSDRRIKFISNDKNLYPELVSYLWPGIGYGGSCFPKDVLALENFATENNLNLPIISGISSTNDLQTVHVLKRFINKINPKKVGLLGLSFKPGTDDLRFSKSLEIIKFLKKNEIEIFAFDPKVKELQNMDFVNIMDTAELVINNSDSLIISTAWNQFKNKNFLKMLKMRDIPILDARLFLPREITKDLKVIGPGFSNIN